MYLICKLHTGKVQQAKYNRQSTHRQNTTGKVPACTLSAGKVHCVQSTVGNILAGKVPAGNVWVGKILQANNWRAFSQQAKYMACKVQVGNILAGKVPAGNVWVGKLVHVQVDWRATYQRPGKVPAGNVPYVQATDWQSTYWQSTVCKVQLANYPWAKNLKGKVPGGKCLVG